MCQPTRPGLLTMLIRSPLNYTLEMPDLVQSSVAGADTAAGGAPPFQGFVSHHVQGQLCNKYYVKF